MIKEAYVSFETAKLLKEKGFDGECSSWYSTKGSQYYNIDSYEVDLDGITKLCSSPTQQMAMQYLRKEHDIHIETKAYPHEDNRFYWCYMIKKMQNNGMLFGYYSIKNKAGFDTYEEAVEAALKYCLTNLI